MITCVRNKQIGCIADAALVVCIVLAYYTRHSQFTELEKNIQELAWAILPTQVRVVVDMSFRRRVVESKTTTWDNRDGVFQVGYSGERIEVGVDVVCELLVTDSGETISVERDCCAGNLSVDKHCIDERNRCALKGVRVVMKVYGLDYLPKECPTAVTEFVPYFASPFLTAAKTLLAVLYDELVKTCLTVRRKVSNFSCSFANPS